MTRFLPWKLGKTSIQKRAILLSSTNNFIIWVKKPQLNSRVSIPTNFVLQPYRLRPGSTSIVPGSNNPNLISYDLLHKPTVMALSQHMQPTLSQSWLVEFASMPFLNLVTLKMLFFLVPKQ